jgi:hypothetical protein
MTSSIRYCWSVIDTKRGTVRVEFGPNGEVVDVHAHYPANRKGRIWDDKTWKRERPRLIRRARLLCAKIGAMDVTIPHSDRLEGKVVVVYNKSTGVTAAGVYVLPEDSPTSFLLAGDTKPPHVFPRNGRKADWEIKAVYDPQ